MPRIVKFKRLSKNSKIPTRSTDQSAGFDLYVDLGSLSGAVLYPHQKNLFNTGISVAIPEGYFGAVYPRSGLASQYGIRLSNCVGVIDSDYRGEIKIPLYNDSSVTYNITNGQRVAQLIIQQYDPDFIFEEVEDLDETERGSSGFGSTGI